MEINKTKELMDLALHPVRMRILTLLAGSAGLTPLQMAEQMSDVPQATLYRHVNRLAKAGLLMVAEERPVRGTLEKVYVLNSGAKRGPVSEETLAEFKRLSKADHLRYFTAFTVSLLDDFSRYLNSTGERAPDFVEDGVGYHKIPLFLSEAEFAEFSLALNQALAPFLALQDGPDRKKRLLTTVMMPAAEPIAAADGTDAGDQEDE